MMVVRDGKKEEEAGVEEHRHIIERL